MAYSDVDDLLTGDLMISAKVDKRRFVDDAAKEIDSKIGFIYELPLTPIGDPEPEQLPLHERLLLEGINNKLASGRLILTLNVAGEGTTLHAYGLRLITEAMQELMLIANGTVDLSAVRIPEVTDDGVFGHRSPAITNVDATSAVETFYEWAKRAPVLVEPYGTQPTWSPGP